MRVLDWVSCICYQVQFQKHKKKNVLALLNFESEINIMTPAHAAQLDFKMQKTDLDTQKIYRSSLETYGMVIAIFQILDKLNCSRIF